VSSIQLLVMAMSPSVFCKTVVHWVRP